MRRDNPADDWFGFGYHPHYEMCWSPLRFGDRIVNNYQLWAFFVAPISISFVLGLFWHYRAWRLLRSGGAQERSIQEPRERQLTQSRIIVVVHTVFCALLLVFFLLRFSWAEADPIRSCGNPFDDACTPDWHAQISPGFSIMLCLRGAVDVLAGGYANREVCVEVFHTYKRRSARLVDRVLHGAAMSSMAVSGMHGELLAAEEIEQVLRQHPNPPSLDMT